MSHPTPSPYDPDRGDQDQQRHGGQQDQPYVDQQQQQQPYGQQPYGGQAYGGQPYGQQPYGAEPYPPTHGQQYYGTASRPNNTMAIVSLIAGIAGLTVVPFIASVVAVITGHMARRQIAETGDEGGGLATAGLVMGWIGVVLGVLLIVAAVLFFGVMAASVSTVGTS